MTEIQFNEIKERLTQWRQERHLTYENQQAGFLGNVFEKVSEYFRAKNDLEKIDALCDIAVFCFNVNDVKFSNYECYMKSDKVDCEFFNIVSKINSIIIYKANFEESPVKVFLDTLIALLHKKCKNLGFNFYKCMLQTIKEIESRTGYYDENLKKFVDKICAFSKDEALSNVSKDFGFLGNSIIYKLTQEDKNFWFITCKEIETNLQIDYKVKKIYKADYKSCRL